MSTEALLATATKKDAIDAIYYVTRLIRHRVGLKARRPLLRVQGLKNEPSAKAAKLGRKIVKVIESENKISLQNISPEVAASIVGELEELAKLRYSEGATVDAVRGDALLRMFRLS